MPNMMISLGMVFKNLLLLVYVVLSLGMKEEIEIKKQVLEHMLLLH